MKINVIILFTAIASCMLLGCNKNVDIDGQEEDCLLMLNVGGDVDLLETPLTKSPSLDDLYLLQVYKNDARIPYASGVFDNVDALKVYLKKGNDFYIVVSLIRDGKSILREKGKYSDVNNSVCVESMTTIKNGNVVKKDKSESTYNYNLFAWNQAYNATLWLAVNEIFYNDFEGSKSRKGISYYTDANSTELLHHDLERTLTQGNNTYTNSVQPEFVNIGLTNPYNYTYRNGYTKPYFGCNDWLYGKTSVKKANGTMITQTVELKRVGFQVQLDPVMGITDGSVSVSISKNYTNLNNSSAWQTILSGTFTDETTESIGPLFFSYPDAELVWNEADGYEEEFRVSVTWLRGIGVSQSFGSIPIKMKRNMLNHVKISVGTDDGDAGMNMVVESDGGEGDTINASL